jgi:hypothetical protein
MHRFTRTAILATAAVALASAPLASATAHEFHRDQHWRHHRHHDDAGVAIAAGVLGLAAGAIIGGALATPPQPQPYGPPPAYVPDPDYTPDYYPPAPKTNGPTVITVHDGGELAPWSPEWNRYCANRYPTFNPRTGTYRGYDGHDHFCVGP